jgi:nucleoside-diphosphate-sugar epimerase
VALVTGASGFLGRRLVAALLAQGRSVVALCRQPEALSDLRHPGLHVTAGDLRDPLAYRPFLAPGVSLFHLAGLRSRPGVRFQDLEKVNVESTLDLARQAGDRGAARILHVATALIYGAADGERARSEADDLDPAPSAYVRSKVEAMRGLRKLARQGLPVVTACPTIVFGPDHPSHPNRVTAEIRRLSKGGPRIWLAGGGQQRDLVFVDDVIGGLLAAEERGREGEEYLLGGEAVSPRELGRQIRALMGRRGGLALPLPAGPFRWAAGIADRLRGHDAGAGYATAVETLLREWRFSSGKACRDLGYRPRSLAEGLAHTVEWLRFPGGVEQR